MFLGKLYLIVYLIVFKSFDKEIVIFFLFSEILNE